MKSASERPLENLWESKGYVIAVLMRPTFTTGNALIPTIIP
jgi:hypothetical protein